MRGKGLAVAVVGVTGLGGQAKNMLASGATTRGEPGEG